jgi:hypothetical protein
MSLGFGITIALVASVAIALLIGQICHVADLEKDPLDPPLTKRPGGAFLRVVDSGVHRKY